MRQSSLIIASFAFWGVIFGSLCLFYEAESARADECPARSLTQGPAEGPPGTEFTLRGAGFTPNTVVMLYFWKPDYMTYDEKVVLVDAQGEFEITHTFPPDLPPDDYWITAIDELHSSTCRPPALDFTITEEILSSDDISGDIDNNEGIDLRDVIAALQLCAGMRPSLNPGIVTKVGLKEAIFDLQIVSGIRKLILFATEGDQPVNIDFSLISPSAPSNSIQAMLPDGKMATLVNTETTARKDDSYTWFGEIKEYEGSSAVLSVVDGMMFGHMEGGGNSYFIQPEGDSYKVVKHDPAKIAPHGDDAIVPDSEELRRISGKYAARNDEDGSAIDVLILYTAQMQTKYGSSLSSLIQHLADLTNQAYINSGINTQIRLAHAELYDHSASREGTDNDTALYHIKDSNEVAEIRELHKADLVNLLRVFHSETASACGRGFVMGSNSLGQHFEAFAFSVVEVRPVTEADPYYCSELTFAHEIGHNLGCAHDRDHAGYDGAYNYSYGYDIPGEFATIMSYDHPEITYFSTPQISYQGNRIGKDADEPDSAYNALTINNTRVIAANFRVKSNASTSTTTTIANTTTSTTTTVPITTTTSTSTTTTSSTTVPVATTTTISKPETLIWDNGNWNETNWN